MTSEIPFYKLARIYAAVMGPTPGFLAGVRYTVRLWDGIDGAWVDCEGLVAVAPDEALRGWYRLTEGGTKKISFDEIDYYRVFLCGTEMYWGHDREMFRDPEGGPR